VNVRNFVLSFYSNTSDGVHIQRVEKPREAKSLHTHAYYQIYYIAKGALTHYMGAETSYLCAGDMFIVPPGVAHRIEDHEGIVFYSLSFMKDTMEDTLRTTELAASFLRGLENNMQIRPKVTVPTGDVLRIESIIEEIYTEFEKKEVGCDALIRLNIARLLTLFARIYVQTEPPVVQIADKNQFLLRCVDYVEHNYHLSLSLDAVVKLSTMSRNEFCQNFRAITGYSFHQYVNVCRIRRAQELLRRGDKITALYAFCGYRDFSTFYRNFVKLVGMSPEQYQKNQK